MGWYGPNACLPRARATSIPRTGAAAWRSCAPTAYRSQVADGTIVLCDSHGARVVADGLGYTNEALPSPDGLG